MYVSKATQDKVLAVLQSMHDIIKHRDSLLEFERSVAQRGGMCQITNGFPEQGGGGASAMNLASATSLTIDESDASDCSGGEGAPEVAASDDGDGDGDPDSDRRRPRSKTSHLSPPPALLAFEPLSHYVSLGRSRIYQLIAADEFPKPIKIGKSSRWVKAEIDAWISKQATNQQAEG
ncbi:helix-turn-helix transcriptional regulator [Comamonas sp.]|uniref:helix-turn-helix transcriptional regulator n=1 Tax=Comamonas sp. TaxID=34028 RepID=UPI002FC7CEC5